MKATNTDNELFVIFVCADIRNRKIYVTSETMRRSILYTAAANMICKYKARYPDFEIEVNDKFFLRKFGVMPI